LVASLSPPASARPPATMGFWFGTFIFFLIQVVVTLSINKYAKRPNKGCVRQS
jgi:hypothetical protein